jgi:hypothetical protein
VVKRVKTILSTVLASTMLVALTTLPTVLIEQNRTKHDSSNSSVAATTFQLSNAQMIAAGFMKSAEATATIVGDFTVLTNPGSGNGTVRIEGISITSTGVLPLVTTTFTFPQYVTYNAQNYDITEVANDI